MSLFHRRIDVEVDDEGENLRIKGRLRDLRQDAELHGMEAEMLVSVWDGEIIEASGAMPAMPMRECERGLETLGRLVGVKIQPGFSDVVKGTIGSKEGCTHLSNLVMNMGNVSVQGRGAYVRKHFQDGEELREAWEASTRDLALVDSCVCWTEDGPILRRIRAGGQADE